MTTYQFNDHLTVTDYLISKGVKFHPETVVIQAQSVLDKSANIKEALAGETTPIFPYCNIEYLVEREFFDSDVQERFHEQKVGVVIHFEYLRRYNYAIVTSFMAMRAGVNSSIYPVKIELDNESTDEYLSHEDYETSLEIPDSIRKEISIEACKNLAAYGLVAFYLIHNRQTLEISGYSRQVKRRVEQKTGKKPSAHYILLNETRIERELAQKRVGKKRGAVTLRRGFFFTQPDTHPLAQFAGKTFWSPAIVKAGAENKIYRVSQGATESED